MMIKVLFVDDHEMVRIGVSAYLSAQSDIEVIGEADNGLKAVSTGNGITSGYHFDGFGDAGNGWHRSDETNY